MDCSWTQHERQTVSLGPHFYFAQVLIITLDSQPLKCLLSSETSSHAEWRRHVVPFNRLFGDQLRLRHQGSAVIT